MAKQLAWVFRSYLTRPLFLVGLCVWIIFQIVMSVAAWLDSAPVPRYPQIQPTPNSVVVSNEKQLSQVRRDGKQHEVTFLDTGVVLFMTHAPTLSISEIASEFPNAQTVMADIPPRSSNTDPDSVVNQLREFKHLKELVLSGYIQTFEDLKPLESLTRLNSLDISGLIIANPTNKFPSIPRLRRLITGAMNEANDQFVKSIAGLPALNQLVLIAKFGDDPAHCITNAGLQSLRQSNTLQLLFASQARIPSNFDSDPSTDEWAIPSDGKWSDRQLTITIAAALGQRAIVQTAYRNNQPPTLPAILFGVSAMIGFFCGLQLASQRGSHFSWITPGHRFAPLVVMAIWITSLSALSTCTTILFDYRLANIFLLHICCMVMGAVAGLITLAPFLPTAIRIAPALLVNIGFVSLIAIHPNIQRVLPISDFARGRFQLEGTVVALISLGALVSILLLVYFIHHEYQASVNPFRAIARGESVRPASTRIPIASKGPQRCLFNAYDKRLLDAISRDRFHTPAGQTERWRAASPTGGWSYWGIMMVSIASVSLISSLLPPPLSVSTRLGSLTPIFLMFPLMIGVAWRQRKRVMSFELLHPISRVDFIHQIRTAFLRDLVPVFFWQAIIVLYISYFGGIDLPPIDVLRKSLVLAPSVVLILTSVAAAVVLVRGGWGIGAIYAFVCIVFGSTMSLIAVMFRNDLVLAIVSASTSVVSIIAMMWMASIWRRIEFGR